MHSWYTNEHYFQNHNYRCLNKQIRQVVHFFRHRLRGECPNEKVVAVCESLFRLSSASPGTVGTTDNLCARSRSKGLTEPLHVQRIETGSSLQVQQSRSTNQSKWPAKVHTRARTWHRTVKFHLIEEAQSQPSPDRNIATAPRLFVMAYLLYRSVGRTGQKKKRRKRQEKESKRKKHKHKLCDELLSGCLGKRRTHTVQTAPPANWPACVEIM